MRGGTLDDQTTKTGWITYTERGNQEQGTPMGVVGEETVKKLESLDACFPGRHEPTDLTTNLEGGTKREAASPDARMYTSASVCDHQLSMAKYNGQ